MTDFTHRARPFSEAAATASSAAITLEEVNEKAKEEEKL